MKIIIVSFASEWYNLKSYDWKKYFWMVHRKVTKNTNFTSSKLFNKCVQVHSVTKIDFKIDWTWLVWNFRIFSEILLRIKKKRWVSLKWTATSWVKVDGYEIEKGRSRLQGILNTKSILKWVKNWTAFGWTLRSMSVQFNPWPSTLSKETVNYLSQPSTLAILLGSCWATTYGPVLESPSA